MKFSSVGVGRNELQTFLIPQKLHPDEEIKLFNVQDGRVEKVKKII